MRKLAGVIVATIGIAACAPHRTNVSFDMRPASIPAPSLDAKISPASESYANVGGKSAAILGCDLAPESPICAVAMPTADEDSAFIAEGNRLLSSSDSRCRKLGEAIIVHEPEVRMYRKALVRNALGESLYGVGHAYEIDDVWLVRIARRIDDLNERTIQEKTRTLRHEMSHTIGATETPGFGWTAEDYATRCG